MDNRAWEEVGERLETDGFVDICYLEKGKMGERRMEAVSLGGKGRRPRGEVIGKVGRGLKGTVIVFIGKGRK